MKMRSFAGVGVVPVRATVSWWSRMAMVRVEGCALLTTMDDFLTWIIGISIAF